MHPRIIPQEAWNPPSTCTDRNASSRPARPVRAQRKASTRRMENQTRNQLAMLGERRAANDAAFKQKLEQMALPLAPLVQLTTGDVHPAFPQTLLNFWLLTDAQLEELAHFYHQRTPCRYTFHYPCPINVSLLFLFSSSSSSFPVVVVLSLRTQTTLKYTPSTRNGDMTFD